MSARLLDRDDPAREDRHDTCGRPWSEHTPVWRDGRHVHACPDRPDWHELDLDRRFHLTDRPAGGPAEPDPEDDW